MSNVWFCSDLHFGHEGIGKFRESLGIKDEQHNRSTIKDDWKELVHKKDIVYILGDAAFTIETIKDFAELPGTKYLIRGNHDKLNTSVYLKYFKEVYGLLKYKEFWLSHAPIHPYELRGKINLHGHVHFATLIHNRYVNCCPEYLWPTFGSSLVSLDQLRKHIEDCNRRPGS